MTAAASRQFARVCLGLLAAVAATTAVAEPVRLRYKFHPGEQMAMRVAHRALTETTMNGTTQSVETMTDSTKTWRVVVESVIVSTDCVVPFIVVSVSARCATRIAICSPG